MSAKEGPELSAQALARVVFVHARTVSECIRHAQRSAIPSSVEPRASRLPSMLWLAGTVGLMEGRSLRYPRIT